MAAFWMAVGMAVWVVACLSAVAVARAASMVYGCLLGLGCGHFPMGEACHIFWWISSHRKKIIDVC